MVYSHSRFTPFPFHIHSGCHLRVFCFTGCISIFSLPFFDSEAELEELELLELLLGSLLGLALDKNVVI